MKKFIKIVAVILLIFILLIAIMKLFFPVYQVVPIGTDSIITEKYVVAQKYFNEEGLREEDLILFAPIKGLNDYGVLVLPYNEDVYKKYQEYVIGKIIFKF